MGFVSRRMPCWDVGCGSSDGVAVNEDGSAKCFSGNHATHGTTNSYVRNYEEAMGGVAPTMRTTPSSIPKRSNYSNDSDIRNAEYSSLTDRSISLETAKLYGVKVTKDAAGSLCKHFYPYYRGSEVVGHKIRKINEKQFSWSGDAKEPQLFGQHLVQKGSKALTITEGECDAMAAYELMGRRFPAVSLPNGIGAAERDIRNNIEFVESFESIYLSFDSDQQGKDKAIKVAKLLTPGKVKILTYPEGYKDANDMLRAGQHKQYIDNWWNAITYTPAGVLSLSDNFDQLFQREKKESVPYPWHGLNQKLLGLRQGELVTFTGGTGLGKTSIIRELEHWLLKETKDTIGIIALEEDWTRTADGIISIEANKQLYIDSIREDFGQEAYEEVAHNIMGGDNKDRVLVHSHFGSSDFDDILSKIKYMVVGRGCKWIILDHLQMIVSASEQGNERALIDKIMTDLRKLVEETKVGMLLVSHLRRLEGNKGHENGAAVSLSHLRGSGGIAQISDCVIAIERDQQSEDELEARTTHLRILKSRYTGNVGMAAHLRYDDKTGRLHETEYEEDELTDDIPF
tara:strand:- start:245 stop:1954 length:1710 start_codon:yes stop_codon:yes gene_type:complete